MKYSYLVVPLLLLCAQLQAAGIEEERVQFESGSSGANIDGQITGDTIRDYLLRASAGQTLEVTLETDNSGAYFNLMRGSDPAAIHIGSTAGNHFEGVLPADGDYRIRVYLMRSAARRNEGVDYSLAVSITGTSSSAASESADYADGLSGGPDYWVVANLATGDTLNVRSAPGTDSSVVGELANGEQVRNLGCKMVGESRWCHIEAGSEQKFSGWANGRYFVEGGASGSTGEATGVIPCATAAGQPAGTCPFRVSRGTGGTASVWIKLPSGGERYIEFREGKPIGTNPGLNLYSERMGDLTLIRIGDVERYEIPDAMIFGG